MYLIKKAGEQGIVVIQDISKLSWKHYYTPAFPLVKSILELDNNHYPEMLHRVYAINCPSFFYFLWKVVKPWIDPRTLEKINILGSDYMKIISVEIDDNQFAKQFGGGLDIKIPTGGIYGGAMEDGSTIKPIEITVPARGHIEALVNIEQKDSAIGLQFNTNDSDVAFGIFYENATGERTEILPVNKYNAHIEPVQKRIKCDNSGKYILHWDNSYSFFKKKKVTYEVVIEPPLAAATPTTEGNKKKKKKKKKRHHKKKDKKKRQEITAS